MWAWMTHFPKPVSPRRQRFLLCAGVAGQEWRAKGCSPRGRSKVRKARRGRVTPLNQSSVSGQLSISDTRTELRQAGCTREAELLDFCDLNTAFPLSARPKGPAAQGPFLVSPAMLLHLVPPCLPGPHPAKTSVHRLSTSSSPQIQTQTFLKHCRHLLPLVCHSLSLLNPLSCCLYRETSTAKTSDRLKDRHKPDLNTLSSSLLIVGSA